MKISEIEIARQLETVATPELNDVQQRLQGILDYWGPNGARWASGGRKGEALCAMLALSATMRPYGYGEQRGTLMVAAADALENAAKEQGYMRRAFNEPCGAALCSDSGFDNARKMVLRAIELAA